MSTLPDGIIEKFNEDKTITFTNTKSVDPTSFTYKGNLREPILHWVIPQVELPPYKVFFPTFNHHREQRIRYYKSHNYLCELPPEREEKFLYHLQQYQPPKDYRVELQSYRHFCLGLLPHEKQDV